MFQVWVGSRPVSFPDYADLQRNPGLADLAAYRVLGVSLRTGDAAERVYDQAVSNNFFNLQGVTPTRGRPLAQGDSQAAVVSHGSWQRRFGGDPNIIGRTVSVNGVPFTVIGVLPADYRSVIGYGVTHHVAVGIIVGTPPRPPVVMLIVPPNNV